MNRQSKELKGVANFHLWGKGKNSSSRDDSHEYHPMKSNVKIYPHEPYQPPQNAPEISLYNELERLRRVRQENVAIKSQIVKSTLAQNSYLQPQQKYKESDQPPSHYSHDNSADNKSDEIRWLEKELASRKFGHGSSHKDVEKLQDESPARADEKHMSRDTSKTSLGGHNAHSRSSLRSNATGRDVRKRASSRHDASSDEELGGSVEDSEESDSSNRRRKKERHHKKKNSQDNGKDAGKESGGGEHRQDKVRKKDSVRKSKEDNYAITMELQKIRDHMAVMIEDNRDVMTQVAKSAAAGAGDIEEIQLQEKRRRQEMKSKIHNLLSRGDTYRMPLWRHRLAGERDPPSERVMRGKQLFRVAARLVLYFFAQPRARVRSRRLGRRNADSDALLKNLILFLEACGLWIGKAIKVPVASVVQVCWLLLSKQRHEYLLTLVLLLLPLFQDTTVDFNPVDNKLRRRHHIALPQRMLQLKVSKFAS